MRWSSNVEFPGLWLWAREASRPFPVHVVKGMGKEVSPLHAALHSRQQEILWPEGIAYLSQPEPSGNQRGQRVGWNV